MEQQNNQPLEEVCQDCKDLWKQGFDYTRISKAHRDKEHPHPSYLRSFRYLCLHANCALAFKSSPRRSHHAEAAHYQRPHSETPEKKKKNVVQEERNIIEFFGGRNHSHRDWNEMRFTISHEPNEDRNKRFNIPKNVKQEWGF